MNNYLINDEVYFIPTENKLTSCHSPESGALLTTPASKCLYILLEHAPEIVSYDELLQRVWMDNGVIVPLNTLHQSISIIRRGFKKINPKGAPIIKNIPATGFRITVKTQVINEKDNKKDSEKEKIDIRKKIEANLLKVGLTNNMKMTLSFFALGFMLTGLLYLFIFDKKDVINFHDNYRQKTTKDGCHIYSNARVKYDHVKQDDIHNHIKNEGFTCEDYPWEYTSTYKASSVSSALKCRYPIMVKKKDNCISFYFRDGE